MAAAARDAIPRWRSAAARVLTGALAALPLRALHRFGNFLGVIGRVVPNPLRRVARINVDMCFAADGGAARDELWRATLGECGKAAAELPALCAWPAARWRARIDDNGARAVIEHALQQGRGALVVAPHLGAWELVGVYCAGLAPMTVLYRAQRPSALGDLLNEARRRAGMSPHPATRAGLRAVYRALDRRGLVGVLPDQDPGRRNGVFAPFFGVPARTTTLVARLARRTGAQVILVVAQRLPGARYRMLARPAPAAVADTDALRAAAALNRAIEQMARLIPAQYQWCYKRFRTRPQGEAEIY